MTSLVFVLCLLSILLGIVINLSCGERPMSPPMCWVVVGCVLFIISIGV